MIQAAVAASVATAAAFLGQLEQSVPGWVRDYGVPIVMLAATVWALVAVFKELSRERTARIVDRDRFIDLMRADMNAAKLASEALVRATIDQTNAIKQLSHDVNRVLRVPDREDA